ncbi:hypothetical protein [Microbulbifer spongiae]|uniref:START domain-containing protein n=1 Tax=Microbulbifer spongiae TaxID=2944933 RepID=A0ABY9E839_9GAMM|nr:hypothetical protein [Microbulbifer sp. MI-G]WKD49185.1 hypothetical protein M8T91_14975 [Microbulbifer sp. MI-G]
MNGRKIVSKITVYLLGTIAILLALMQVIQFYWKMSGSSEWQLEIDKNGVQVYSMKSPGKGLKRVKAHVDVQANMHSVIAFFQDQTTCPEFGCLEAKIIDRKSPQLYYSEFKYPFPMNHSVRQFVVKSQFVQDAGTGIVYYYHTAAPHVLPVDDCCFRVTEFNVHYRFIPKENGIIEIEMQRDFNPGVYFPDFMLNKIFVNGAFRVLSRFQSFVDREKYRNAHFDFITVS